MVLASADEARRQRILLKRQQAMQINNECDTVQSEVHDKSSDTQEISEVNSSIEADDNDDNLRHNNKKLKLDVPDEETIVANVYNYLKQEYKFMKLLNPDSCILRPLAPIQQRTAAATGLTTDFVREVIKKDRQRMEINKRELSERQRPGQAEASRTSPINLQKE